MYRFQKLRFVIQGLLSTRCIHKGKAIMTVSSSNPSQTTSAKLLKNIESQASTVVYFAPPMRLIRDCTTTSSRYWWTSYLDILSKGKIPGFGPTTLDVYVISFNSGIVIKRGIDAFWISVCRKLRASNPILFRFDESTASSETFEGFFRKQDSSRPIILLLDEVSWLVGQDPVFADSFVGMLRLLKGNRNERCLHATALVGVQTIKRLLKSPTSLSPFTSETTIRPERFEVADVENLLRQYSGEECVELDAAAIGQDIFERTLGHKGLVGTCCRALSDKMVDHGGHVSVEEWQRYASVDLLDFTRERATYSRIIESLPNLSQTQSQTVGVVLRNGSAKAPVNNDLNELLAEGILIARPTSAMEMDVKCAAPILRNLMIYHVSGPIPKISAPPLTRDELDVEWLLAQTVENIAPQHVFTKQTSNSSGNPSEYAFQFKFASIMEHLLSVTYPNLLYRVLPEAKHRDENDQRRRRLDILVRDHDRSAFGFELLVQGKKSEIDDHLARSKRYRDLHDCRTVYMINLTNDIATTNYYGGTTYEGVTPLHVVYDRDRHEALIKYKDRQEQVSFLCFVVEHGVLQQYIMIPLSNLPIFAHDCNRVTES
ncbi:hypothetical protein BGZ65_006350 [Modicella reniformis]|uniref:Uncharacterized protein n=1 Tax=Modicella reniformis TaxID=1440133 RepID=A0A9P6LTR4_9FUNG|nr:hypothetical protein BGZ65_006350 [Modicella reniformis]